MKISQNLTDAKSGNPGIICTKQQVDIRLHNLHAMHLVYST